MFLIAIHACSGMINKMEKEKDTNLLKSVDRALAMIELIAKNRPLNITQIAERLNTGKATAYRLASTFMKRDWLVKDADLRYQLGPAFTTLTNGSASTVDLRSKMALIMEQLHESTGETIHLTTLEGRKVVYVEQIVSPKPVLSVATIGDYSPAHCVSPGLAQLAVLDEERLNWLLNKPLDRFTKATITDPQRLREELAAIRERGYAINVGGYRPDVGGVGGSIQDAKGNLLGALSICVPVYRLSNEDIESFGTQIINSVKKGQKILED